MTDEELLRRSAQAAGISTYGMSMVSGYLYGNNHAWDPLTHNDTALWLSVTLGIDIQHFKHSKHVEAWVYPIPPVSEDYGDDPRAATRRAIVKVAAQL